MIKFDVWSRQEIEVKVDDTKVEEKVTRQNIVALTQEELVKKVTEIINALPENITDFSLTISRNYDDQMMGTLSDKVCSY